MDQYKKIEQELEAQQNELKRHPVFMGVRNIAALRRLMEYHVFAQFDFAVINNAVAHQLNWPYAAQAKEVFEAYLEIMVDMGASTRNMDTFTTLKKAGVAHADALDNCGAPAPVVELSKFQGNMSADGQLHILVGLLVFTRDHRVHETFIRTLVDAPKPLSDTLKPLDHFIPDYLAFPRQDLYREAADLLGDFCGNDGELWYQVREYSQKAMRLRRRVWDGLLNELVIA